MLRVGEIFRAWYGARGRPGVETDALSTPLATAPKPLILGENTEVAAVAASSWKSAGPGAAPPRRLCSGYRRNNLPQNWGPGGRRTGRGTHSGCSPGV